MLPRIVMLVNPVQLENTELPIDVTLLGIVMLVSPVQRANAVCPIDVTLLGIVMLVSPLQFGYLYVVLCQRIIC